LFRFTVFLVLLIMLNIEASAQTNDFATVKGIVQKITGETLPGITVILKGTTIGAFTNKEGKFEIENIQPGEYELVLSAIGFEKQTLSISLGEGQVLELEINMDEDVQEMEEIVVQEETDAQVLRRSARAVEVIETKEVKLQTVDLGNVMAQTQGVSVRRTGGLGSGTRFSLNGLTDDQIRFFLDGIPLEFAGYSLGIANIPVNLIEQVEIYKGVVPIQFGVDALGGAVNLVTPRVDAGFTGNFSYQPGSFGTHRVNSNIQYFNDQKGLFINASGFYDFTRNNYDVDVEVPDERGRLSDATVPRFHDDYEAYGANAEVGFRQKSWADEASIKLFATDFTKDIQHNNVMTIPYGEVTSGGENYGIAGRYKSPGRYWLQADVTLGYSKKQTQFADISRFVFNWFGERIRERGVPGEIGSATDQILWDDNWFGRINLSKNFNNRHSMVFSSAPTFISRTGNDRLVTDPDIRDPLSAERDLFTLVNGLEYMYQSADDKLENRLFFKHYLQNVRTEESLPGNRFRRQDRESNFTGVGNSLRYRLNPQLSVKASYEWTTRMPRAEEIFGNGILILENLDLEPERSHNANLEFSLLSKANSLQNWRVSVNGFLRAANQLIVLLSDQNTFSFQNVFDARSTGIETAVSWTSPDNRLSASGNVTWQDFRNTSDDGAFRGFKGDRIPNRPYLFANTSLNYRLPALLKNNDQLNLFWNARYVHGFFRTWESAGIREFKQTIPAQFLQNTGITYRFPVGNMIGSVTGEIQNLASAKAFDFFGVQKPGRAMNLKITVQF